jgi:hypothetical protein
LDTNIFSMMDRITLLVFGGSMLAGPIGNNNPSNVEISGSQCLLAIRWIDWLYAD